jgi:predicted kinase
VELVITIGLPASGKTTVAKEWVEEDPGNRVRVERDQLREMLTFGFVAKNEKSVSDIRNQIVETYLKMGKSVIVSDTNFPWKVIRELRTLAQRNNSGFRVIDLTDENVAQCISRDQNRSDKEPVGREVIESFYDRYLNGTSYPYPLPPEEDAISWKPYKTNFWLPGAIIVDIDGTLAKMRGRSPYDWHRVFEDAVNEPVKNHVTAMKATGASVILLSGRDGEAKGETERWLDHHGIPYDMLLMRGQGDQRRDDVVKNELFDNFVRDEYNVLHILDDRDQVVKMWREMGLPCWQVDYGDF